MTERTRRQQACASGAARAALLCFAWAVHGAAPVEESIAQARPSPDAVPPPMPDLLADEETPGAGQSSQRARMFHELQLLSAEVAALRGAVEEQKHRVDRLAREQQERYLGIDRQIAALRSGAPTVAPRPRPAVSTPEQAEPLPSGGGTEAEAYRNAYARIDRGEFDAATAALEALIEAYPNGQYTPNAFYWLGQLHRKAGELEQARQSLVQVITLYPDHNKTPDALYNLGVVYAELGDSARARMYLGRVVDQHPGSTAAGLARTYAENLP